MYTTSRSVFWPLRIAYSFFLSSSNCSTNGSIYTDRYFGATILHIKEVFNMCSVIESGQIESRNELLKSNKTTAIISVGLFGGLATGIVIGALPFVSPAFRKVVLPYVPATSTQIENVLQALRFQRPVSIQNSSNNNIKNNATDHILDLGSGDGRIVIECTKRMNVKAHGVELNPWLVLYSKFRAYREGIHKLATFERKDLFKVDLADYDKIIIFGVDNLMPLIERKTQSDCNRRNKQVTLVVCRFPLPNWRPCASFGFGIDQVWLYRYYPSQFTSNMSTN